jgi:F-type H+-transporting ATPase subunit epsilon
MMTLSILTPDRKVVGPVPIKGVTLPGANGEMTVLPGHAHMLSTLDTGIVSFELENGKKEVGALSTGFMEVKDDKVVVLAETLELAHEIDVDRARRAKEKAEEKLKAKDAFEQDMLKWQRKIQRAMIRIQASEYLLPPV